MRLRLAFMVATAYAALVVLLLVGNVAEHGPAGWRAAIYGSALTFYGINCARLWRLQTIVAVRHEPDRAPEAGNE